MSTIAEICQNLKTENDELKSHLESLLEGIYIYEESGFDESLFEAYDKYKTQTQEQDT